MNSKLARQSDFTVYDLTSDGWEVDEMSDNAVRGFQEQIMELYNQFGFNVNNDQVLAIFT